ncbi:MAG: carboxypeptidase regulatory-like domain-containing protein [Acidobacteria bacterium]|nr:carboxypeptidase regulatory-like domain-containing protein [Acidobacteriota bacterium]
MRRLVLLISFSVVATPAVAQVAQASGRITDPTGAIVPSANVEARNIDTGALRQAQSNTEGYYAIPSLSPGNYEIRVQREGFKSVMRSGLRLLADDKMRLDFVLELGTLAETVSVTGDVPLLSTETSELSKSMTSREYNRLPLIQIGRMRQPANFLFLTPGVHGNLDLNGNENVSATNQIQVHGSQKQNTDGFEFGGGG